MQLRRFPIFYLALCTAAFTLPAGLTLADEPTQEEQLSTMLGPLGYAVAHHVALNNTDWWGNWLDKGNAGYAGFVAASAQPGARCALVYRIQGNEWWYRMRFFFGWTDVDEKVWFAQVAGNVTVGNGDGPYFLDTGAKAGLPVDFSRYYVMICDLPDPAFDGEYSMTGMFWQQQSLDMYVIVPSGLVVHDVKFTSVPKTMGLGETAPVAAIVYDKITGTEYPNLPVTFSTTDNNVSLRNGSLFAASTGRGLVIATSIVTNDVGSVITNVVQQTIWVPMVNTNLYAEVGTWVIDQTSRNWWVQFAPDEEFARLANDERVLYRIDFSNQTEDKIGMGNKFVLGDEWYFDRDWMELPAGATDTSWIAVAEPPSNLYRVVINIGENIHVDRITIYHHNEPTMLLMR